MSAAEAVTQVLFSRPWVDMGWLYGSRSQGRARVDSDYDIAIVVQEYPGFEQLQELREELEEAVQGEVGLAVLNQADTLLCHQAIQGQLLLRRSPAAHAQFVSRICRLAEDDRLHLRQALQWWRAARA